MENSENDPRAWEAEMKAADPAARLSDQWWNAIYEVARRDPLITDEAVCGAIEITTPELSYNEGFANSEPQAKWLADWLWAECDLNDATVRKAIEIMRLTLGCCSPIAEKRELWDASGMDVEK